MLFTEKRAKENWEYWTEDVFGTVTINSTTKLDAKMLDRITLLILKQEPGAETVNGEVRHDTGVVSYTLKRRPRWEDLEDEELSEEICKNTPTSTSETEEEYTARKGLPTWIYVPDHILSWCKRFVGAFLEAWRRR